MFRKQGTIKYPLTWHCLFLEIKIKFASIRTRQNKIMKRSRNRQENHRKLGFSHAEMKPQFPLGVPSVQTNRQGCSTVLARCKLDILNCYRPFLNYFSDNLIGFVSQTA